MLKAIFKSNSGQEIIFDDFCAESEYDTVWVEMCPHCHNKYRNMLGSKCSDIGEAQGTCSVEGCSNEADYYVDFKTEEINIKEEL